DQAPEIVPWIVRETGAVAPKAQFEIRMALGILHKAAAMPTDPQGQVLPSAGGQISIARRVPHGIVGVISPFNFPLILSIRAVAPDRKRSDPEAGSPHADLRRLHPGAVVRRSRTAARPALSVAR